MLKKIDKKFKNLQSLAKKVCIIQPIEEIVASEINLPNTALIEDVDNCKTSCEQKENMISEILPLEYLEIYNNATNLQKEFNNQSSYLQILSGKLYYFKMYRFILLFI